MAVGGSSYVVEWQIGEEEGQRAGPPFQQTSTIVFASRENLERLADFSGVLADADAAAVVAYGPTGISVEAASLAAPRLQPGATIPVHPSLGDARTGAIGLLLTGRRRWCRSSPPPGFGVAALVRAPRLSFRGSCCFSPIASALSVSSTCAWWLRTWRPCASADGRELVLCCRGPRALERQRQKKPNSAPRLTRVIRERRNEHANKRD